MACFPCPFCSSSIPISNDTLQFFTLSFNGLLESQYSRRSISNSDYPCIKVEFYKCPHCDQITIIAKEKEVGGSYKSGNDAYIPIYPRSLSRKYPDYIPKSIRQDYEEAYSILSLSPKASATLSRRCLQGMIRDFWEIKESNLSKAIEKLEGKIPADQWKVIDGVRRIGNIGAHMEKDINLIVDIDPNEALKLLKLIELLIKQWYIDRYDQQQLYSDILDIDESKQEARKNKD